MGISTLCKDKKYQMAMSYGFLNRLRTALRTKPEDGLTNILADLAVGHPDDR